MYFLQYWLQSQLIAFWQNILLMKVHPPYTNSHPPKLICKFFFTVSTTIPTDSVPTESFTNEGTFQFPNSTFTITNKSIPSYSIDNFDNFESAACSSDQDKIYQFGNYAAAEEILSQSIGDEDTGWIW